MIWFYLISGLFLGWSLGANDAANIFGTAVGSRMIKFRTAAIVSAVFVVLGAVISGAGATHTLGKLGAVNAIAGSFTVALAAAVTVTWMTKLKLPVSTSQAIVGAIIGWNLFTNSPTDMNSLLKIVSTWVICPLLSAAFAYVFYKIAIFILPKVRIHMLEQDAYNRIGLIFVGAFGAYSLGANNIANVMGVFVPASPFTDLSFGGLFSLSGTQILFLFGAVAISVGVFTYSYKVMMTVGNDLFKLTPIAAFVVVLSESIVLFLFASKGLESWLASQGLPTIPLVPVSSSQAVIGGILGIVLAKKGRGVNFKVLGKISSGWVTTPIIAAVISFVALFFAQNVFEQKVVKKVNETNIKVEEVLSNESIDKQSVQMDMQKQNINKQTENLNKDNSEKPNIKQDEE
ncbi:MAG: inorganic phosphate transporter [Bacteroidota bacterium]